MTAVSKVCCRCHRELDLSEFHRDRSQKDGHKHACKACFCQNKKLTQGAKFTQQRDAEDARRIREAEDRARRLESDFDQLKPEDFDVSVANDRRLDPRASLEKRQEYSRSMGDHMRALRVAASDTSDVLSGMSPESGSYIGKLAEQERRFVNRRLARSISLADAHEALAIRHFKQAAAEYLRDKIQPTGYAAKSRLPKSATRTVCLLLSDLHLGSELSALDSPMPFRAVEEARRLEYVLRQALDFKPQYRDRSRLLLLINGDVIEGLLGHDMRDGAPLTEQKVVFWRYFGSIIGLCAQQYPTVHVVCQPGNHGRDRVRHPGRATSRKWDGHEWELYWALREMSSSLTNVSWQIDFRSVSVVDVHGSVLGLTHGDTEVAVGDPDSRSVQNAQTFDRINSARTYGVEFDAWALGHFHKPRYQPRGPRVIWNGALVPPNGFARTAGYVGEPCGQWLWEAVEGYPVGDVRFLEVGRAQDEDEQLGKLVEPFRFNKE